jgi:hypothetical protein
MDEWDVILDFGESGGGALPVQYEVSFGGHDYYVRYRHSWLTIDRDLCTDREEEVFVQQLAEEDADDGYWSDKETNVYLYLISKAIRQGSLRSLVLPRIAEVRRHPFYRRGPFPRYVLRVCGLEHQHSEACDRVMTAKEMFESIDRDRQMAHEACEVSRPRKR